MANFVNPYNFVPLGKECNRSENSNANEGVYTGVINYTLLTKTPLFIPDTESVKTETVNGKSHKKYKFFSYNGKPVIPGSEVRGMLRSYYEILTNSCLSAVDDDKVLSKRTSEVYKAGLIEKKENKYILHEAESERYEILKKTVGEEGKKIENAYLIKGEKGFKKKWSHKFVLKADGKHYDINIEDLDLIIKLYQKQNPKAYNKYAKQLALFKKEGKEYFPVYYSVVEDDDKKLVMLSPACITREVYKNKISDMIGDYKSCTSESKMCPACKMFGMLHDTTSIASRIRVTDMAYNGTLDDEKLYVDEEGWTLKPLASPKLGNIEFYMQKPAKEAWFWTYDYYVDSSGDIHVFDESKKPQINGRKFYWHNMSIDEKKICQKEKSDQNITIRPLKSGLQFNGKIYFENLTKKELNQLVYLVNSSELDNKENISNYKYGYKLGAAKPFGLGSVALKVNEVLIRKVKSDNQKVSITDEFYPLNEISDILSYKDLNKKAFRMITYFFATKEKNVTYPRIKSNDKGYEWFTGNRKAYNREEKREESFTTTRKEMVYKKYMKPLNQELFPNRS